MAGVAKRFRCVGWSGAERGRTVAGAGGGAFGEVVGQLGVPGSGGFGHCAMGGHPFLDGPSSVIARVRLHDPGPQSQPGPHKAAAEDTLTRKGFIIGYYPQLGSQLSRRGTDYAALVT